jgi:peptide-methionine (S)-S-oxide reductase
MSQERAIFAGGCFWCMVQPFEEMPGILSVLSGYTGGTTQNPTYEDVLSHQTGHTEAVEIIFDNDVVSYRELVALYWTLTDPTDAFGQFQDRGDNYRPVIFYDNAEQAQVATESKHNYRLQDASIFRLLWRLNRVRHSGRQKVTTKVFIKIQLDMPKVHK